MKKHLFFHLLLLMSFATVASNDKGFPMGYHNLHQLKEKAKNGNINKASDIKQLLGEAHKLLSTPPPSVVDDNSAPIGVDPNDYISYAPYWWPNPNTKSGLPYVRRDGQINAERRAKGDDQAFTLMANSVYTLALAYFYTGDEQYAKRATTFINTWFLDSATRMNPNVIHGQIILGKANFGRRAGINELRFLPHVIDAIPLIQESKAWTIDKEKSLKKWFLEYLNWLEGSDHGQKEKKRENNHGTWYDVQVVSCALFLGNYKLAHSTIENHTKNRISKQINVDGKQPLETARTRSLHYSIYNIRAYFALATLSERIGINLWEYKTEQGVGIQDALDYLVPYIGKQSLWPYKDLGKGTSKKWCLILAQAALKYPNSHYTESLSLALKTEPQSRHYSHTLTIPSKQDTATWNLIWKDEFNGDVLDKTKWSKIPPNNANWGKHMADNDQCYLLSNGNIYLKAVVNNDTSEDSRSFLTGGIYTKEKLSFLYGKVEIRAKMQNAQGSWPAIWMKPQTHHYGSHPNNGEIDIMEHLNRDNFIYQTLHTNYTLKVHKHYPISSSLAFLNTSEFNTYGLEWFPDRIVFTVNGLRTLVYPRLNNLSNQLQWPFDQPFYLLIDQQLGGNWVGSINDKELPVSLVIDFVKVYQQAK